MKNIKYIIYKNIKNIINKKNNLIMNTIYKIHKLYNL